MSAEVSEFVERLRSIEGKPILRWFKDYGFVDTRIVTTKPADDALIDEIKDAQAPLEYVELMKLTDGIKLFEWVDQLAVFAGAVLPAKEALEYHRITGRYEGSFNSFPFFNFQDEGIVSFDLKNPGTILFPYGGKLEVSMMDFLNTFLETQSTYLFPR